LRLKYKKESIGVNCIDSQDLTQQVRPCQSSALSALSSDEDTRWRDPWPRRGGPSLARPSERAGRRPGVHETGHQKTNAPHSRDREANHRLPSQGPSPRPSRACQSSVARVSGLSRRRVIPRPFPGTALAHLARGERRPHPYAPDGRGLGGRVGTTQRGRCTTRGVAVQRRCRAGCVAIGRSGR
jgi:hypothetical protein